MRPTAARVLLSVIAIVALAAAVVTAKYIFVVLAVGACVLLVTSLRTSRRPLTQALLTFRNQAVDVRLWGVPVPPAAPSGSSLILASVNALGAGTHVFFNIDGGVSMHLKVAQPKDPTLALGAVIIGSARYVQWNGKKMPRVGSAPAVFIALSAGSVREPPGSVA
jgi:hypothetical protein